MFLKHHYPLEWWASILTNASEQEISTKLWPHVKHLVYPPDINISRDHMVVDYANGKIRSKLGMIRGMGSATVEPILAGRPYKDIEDFVDKGVAGPSISRKLIHVGVLDSLFPAHSNLMEKLKAYEDAVSRRAFIVKSKEAERTGKKMRQTQPKAGELPSEYINLTPMKDASMRKSVLPSLNVDLFALGRDYGKTSTNNPDKPAAINLNGIETPLVQGDRLRRLDELSGESLEKDVYVAATCFVVKVEEFSYPRKNPTKKALKLVLDADGYTSEKVMWPDYNTGLLEYPKDLKKGTIATVFMKKKVGRKDMSISGIVLESS